MLNAEKEKEFLTQFMSNKDVPSWYCGTSLFQIEAADELSNSIRDDVEQETCHRVRHCLNRLGLSPSVANKDLKVLMKLSGGNDLAFLWFLMELYYKTPGGQYDSINEQIILTSISHLDMITTLRELDRILPPGNASKRQLEQRQKRQLNNRTWKTPPRRKVKKHSSPYFNRLERPIQFGESLALERPDFKVRFLFYDIYKDPNYVPPNEVNRWYAKHFMQTPKGITARTLSEYLKELIAAMNFFPTNNKDVVSIIDLALEQMTRAKKRTVVCKKHQLEEEERKFRLQIKEVEHRQKCLKSLELFPKKQQARLEKIQKMLEKEVEMRRLQYQRKLRAHIGGHSYIRVLGQDGYCEHLIEDDQGEECGDKQQCAKTASAASLSIRLNNSLQTVVHTNDFKTSTNADKLIAKNHRLSFGREEDEKDDDLNNVYCGNLATPQSSERFFIGPNKNKPYKFDYPKIFHYEEKKNERIFIKKKCVQALDEEGKVVVKKMVDQTPDLADLSKRQADEIWKEEQQAWNAAHEERTPSEVSDPYPKDMPRLPFYDCEDKKLMSEMLKIALLEMSKYPKFVLASLPNAYKLPMLREWIYQRYGKRYTQRQRLSEISNSLKIMSTLQKLKLQTKIPRPSAIGAITEQNYGCHKYIMRKVHIARQAYYNHLNTELLRRARYFWFAMRNFLCALPLNATFFAYLPSRKADNYLFKPWKLHEYMNAKAEWDLRRSQKKKEM
ncbi:uncharacterized protein LOC129243505 [Anastrepha obliqua]|uniref:uncharacterized protein LOC129243505 n=1 Tax=Anastrepha obliqua TaxID=95512 RepID=UPI002409E07C|nr:uncharacterized protein LOC129243505 [Anastrepha obliqua]